jgi:hypothetical protein
MDEATLAVAVEDLQTFVRADGARLDVVTLDPAGRRIELALDLSGAECAECVLPGDILAGLLRDRLAAGPAGGIELVLHDPRTTPAEA